MNFDRANILNSGVSLPEWYKVLSSEGIRTTEFKTGVLLYLYTPRSIHYPCEQCSNDRAACVRAAGGYIVHDAGDVVLAEWVKEDMPLSDTISQAVQCAFKMRDVCKIQRSPHDSRQAFNIAISAGRFSRVRLGDEESQVCVVFGPAVEEIRSAELLAEQGDIVLSPEAWRLCDRENLTVEHIDNEGAVKVQHIRNQESVSEEDLRLYNTDMLMSGYPRAVYLLTNVERRSIICNFMIQTALDKIHENSNWQDLSEIWPVSIIFVYTDVCGGHHKVRNIIAEQMFRCHGEICHDFFFEEGCIFVCAVGLLNVERQDKAANAMQAAYQIHQTCLREIHSLSSISVGVTTGRVFYEFGQHPFRIEYKVYGQTVCLAAKLTMDYPGTVSCDVPTLLYSMMPLSCVMPQAIISPHEGVLYCEEIIEILAGDAAGTSQGMNDRRLALAHMQTIVRDEQMVLKYASAIGHTFSIEMLKDILHHMSGEDFIKSLKSLVRVGIIKCAFVPRNASSTNTCECKKNSTEYTQVSMDPVWPCWLMVFCNSDEREMVYKLIQRRKYLFRMIHKQCANYLEKKAYRCSKCEAKTFIFEHQVATDHDNEHLQEIYKTIRPYEVFQSQGVSRQNQRYPTEGNGNETENFLAKVKSVLKEARDQTTSGSCECAQLVERFLFPRIRHWRCAEDMPRTFYYLLESAAACVYLQNDGRALEYLTEARSILENGHFPAFPSTDPGHVQICELQRAFMYRLTGEILFRAGKILEAEERFRKALKLLNCKLPQNSCAQSLKLIHQKMKKLLYRSRQFQSPEKTKLGRLQECISCLSFLWQIGCMCGQHRSALLAITMEINMAIRSADPFKILYSAINYLKYSQLKGEESECRRLEAFLCRTCASLSDHPEGRRLISHLTRTLAVVKLYRGDLEQSIKCSMRAQQLSEALNEPGLDVRATAALHLPLLLTDRYRESVQQILTLEKLSEDMSSSVAKGWFYAACMNWLLYAGFAFRPFEECLAFVEASRSDANLKADKSLMLHLYSAVALWYARLADWEKFAVFFDKAYDVYAQIPPSLESISGVVMLLECSVLLCRKKVTESNSSTRSTFIRTHKFFSDIRQQFGRNHILAPRVLHLNAYLHQLTESKTLVQGLLREALLLCEKQGNLLDQTWIRQSKADWSGACSNTPAEWSTVALSMPSWDEAAVLQPEQLLKYRFRLKQAEDRRRPRTLREMCRLLINP